MQKIIFLAKENCNLDKDIVHTEDGNSGNVARLWGKQIFKK